MVYACRFYAKTAQLVPEVPNLYLAKPLRLRKGQVVRLM